MVTLLDFFNYVALISYRFSREYVPALKEEKDKMMRMRKAELAKEMRSMAELY
jgi:hypothetical protein